MNFDAVWSASFGRLNEAVRADNYEQFCDLLTQEGISVNSPDNRGYQPCHLAALTSRPHLYLRELLKFDVVDVNSGTYDGSTPLILICRRNTSTGSDDHLLEAVWLLVENGANINTANNHLEFPLMLAVRTNKYEIVAYLCTRPELDIDQQGTSAIYKAVKKIDLSYLEILLKCGASLDDRRLDQQTVPYTLLSNAVRYRNLRAVERLVEVARERGIEDFVNIPMADGTTSLMIACQTNCYDIINYLVRNGANVNAVTCDQVTVLHFIAEFCDVGVLRLILSKFDLTQLPTCDDVNDDAIFKVKNPLHLAISALNGDIIQFLIEKKLYSPDSLQAISHEDDLINGVRADADSLLYSALGFALSTGTSRIWIDYLLKSGASLELHSETIVPPIFCVDSYTNIMKQRPRRIFRHLLSVGFNINKFAGLHCKNYFSTLVRAYFNPKMMAEFLQHGLNPDNLFNSELEELYQKEFASLALASEAEQSGCLESLFESCNLIYRTANVQRFWKFMRFKILGRISNHHSGVMKVQRLFESPSSLIDICKHKFRMLVWQASGENTAKFHEQMKAYPPFINSYID